MHDMSSKTHEEGMPQSQTNRGNFTVSGEWLPCIDVTETWPNICEKCVIFIFHLHLTYNSDQICTL